MKFEGYDEEIVVTVSRQFEEGIVSAVSRQLSQTAFSSSVHQGNTSEVQQLAAQSTSTLLEIFQTPSTKILRLLPHPEIVRR